MAVLNLKNVLCRLPAVRKIQRRRGLVPFIGVSRLRMMTDGEGITTLAAFHGCPLRCKYCLNPQSLCADGMEEWHTPRSLFKKVRGDNLYFQSTGGGITFGGGEPLLYTDFIVEFKNLCPDDWRITIETSLNVSIEQLQKVVDTVDAYIVDIKDINNDVYSSYTGKNNFQVIDNLKYLVEYGKADKVTVRIPLIPGYNDVHKIEKSLKLLEQIGIEYYERLTYTTTLVSAKEEKDEVLLRYGKSKCKILKSIRTEFAQKHGIAYSPCECNSVKPCSGTCPVCEAELKYLNSQIYENTMKEKAITGQF